MTANERNHYSRVSVEKQLRRAEMSDAVRIIRRQTLRMMMGRIRPGYGIWVPRRNTRQPIAKLELVPHEQ